MIQTREEFIEWIDRNFNGVSVDPASPLWIPEHDLHSTLCGWFVTVGQVRNASGTTKTDYWSWCRENLQGYVRCFWSNNQDNQECWGFTNYNDIQWWLLKWTT